MKILIRRIVSFFLAFILFYLPPYSFCSRNPFIFSAAPAYAANDPLWTGEPKQIEYQYDDQSRLIATSDGVQFSYDNVGRIITRQTPEERQDFVWDSQGRLIEVNFNDGTQTKYQYDPLGRMSRRTDRAGETTRFVYDELKLIQERRNNESVIASYIYTKELDNPVLMTAGGKNYLFIYDRLGSVVALADVTDESSNSIVAQYRYDAWGNILSETETVRQPFRFAGYIWEPDVELYYLQNRWYDPSIGRFISPDPLLPTTLNPQDWNAYAYASNDPVNRIDSMGLRSELSLSRGYSPWDTLKEQLNKLPDILVRNFQKQSGFTVGGTQNSKNRNSWTKLPSPTQTSIIDGWGTTNPEIANIIFNPTLGRLPDVTQGFTPQRMLEIVDLGQLPQRMGNVIAYANQLAFPQIFGHPWFDHLLNSDSSSIAEVGSSNSHIFQLEPLVGYTNDITAIPYLYTNNNFKRPSGISLKESAKALASLTDITGAVWDEENNQLIITGIKGEGPGIHLNDLIVAIESLSAGQDIGVSIDPIPHNPDEPLPDRMTVRYIPEQIQGTNLGNVLFEADRQLKVLSLGHDQVTNQPAPTIEGYQSQVSRIDAEYIEKGETVWNRMWFEPEPLSIKTAPGIFRFNQAKLKLDTEYFDPGPPPRSKSGSDPIAEEFVKHINHNYSTYADKISAFKELEQAAKLVSVAKWIQSESIPVDLAWLRYRRIFDPISTPTTTPARTFYSSSLIEKDGKWYQLGIYGGVTLAPSPTSIPDTSLNQQKQKILVRPSDASVTWEDPSGETYVAISLETRATVGGVRASVADFTSPGENPMFSLVRYSDSFRPAQAGSFQGSWFAEPAALEFPNVNNPHREGEKVWQTTVVLRDHKTGSATSFDLVHYPDQSIGYRSTGANASLKRTEKGYQVEKDNQTYEFDLTGELQKISLSDNSISLISNHTRKAIYVRKDGHLSEIQFLGRKDEILENLLLNYNGSKQLDEVKNKKGEVVRRYEYDANNRIQQVKDSENLILASYTYDDSGRLIQIQGANGELFKADYDAKGRVNNLTIEGNTFAFRYNGSGDDVKITRNGEFIGKIQFDQETGRVVRFEGAEGPISSVEQDEDSSAQTQDGSIRIKLADSPTFLNIRANQYGAIEEIADSEKEQLLGVIRDTNNRPRSITTFSGATTNIEYDGSDFLHRITTAYEDHTIEFIRDGKGGWKLKDQDGVILQNTPEGDVWVDAISIGNGRPATVRHDLAGKYVELTTPTEERFRLYQDSQDRLFKIETPFGQFQVESSGQLVATVKNSENQQQQYTFNKFGNPVQVQDAQGSTLQLEYDPAKNTTQIVRPDKTTDEIIWDSFSHLVEIKNSQSGGLRVQRDRFGHIVQIESMFSNEPLRLEYDALSRVTHLQQGLEVDIEVQYLDHERMTRIKSQGSEILIQRDLAGRVTYFQDVDNRQIHYLYSPGGRVLRIAYPPSLGQLGKFRRAITGQTSGVQVFYEYNEKGLTKSVALGKRDRVVAELIYDADSRLIQIKTPSATIDHSYASSHLTEKIGLTSVLGEVLYEMSYEYNKAGQCIREQGTNGERTFIYNNSGELVEIHYSEGYKQHINYDTGGNRLSMKLEPVEPSDPPVTRKIFRFPPMLHAQTDRRYSTSTS